MGAYLKLKGRDKLLIGSVYRSGSSGKGNSENLNKLINKVGRINPSHLLMCGDTNFKGINWMANTASSSEQQDFLDCTQDNFLFQHVHEPTRFRIGQAANSLDVVFTNEETMVDNIAYLPGVGLSDHV